MGILVICEFVPFESELSHNMVTYQMYIINLIVVAAFRRKGYAWGDSEIILSTVVAVSDISLRSKCVVTQITLVTSRHDT